MFILVYPLFTSSDSVLPLIITVMYYIYAVATLSSNFKPATDLMHVSDKKKRSV